MPFYLTRTSNTHGLLSASSMMAACLVTLGRIWSATARHWAACGLGILLSEGSGEEGTGPAPSALAGMGRHRRRGLLHACSQDLVGHR